MDFTDLLAAHPWAVWVALGLVAAPWLAALLPRPTANSGWAPLRALLDVVAGNVGNAANAALASPAARGLLTGLPGAVFSVEHLVAAYRAGTQAATITPPSPASAANVPASPGPAAEAPEPADLVSVKARLTASAAAVALLALTGCGTSTPIVEGVASGALGAGAAASPVVATVVSDGQLVCQIGPAVVAVIDAATGSPVLARGAPATYLAGICAVLNGVPAPPPPGTVTLPAAPVHAP